MTLDQRQLTSPSALNLHSTLSDPKSNIDYKVLIKHLKDVQASKDQPKRFGLTSYDELRTLHTQLKDRLLSFIKQVDSLSTAYVLTDRLENAGLIAPNQISDDETVEKLSEAVIDLYIKLNDQQTTLEQLSDFNGELNEFDCTMDRFINELDRATTKDFHTITTQYNRLESLLEATKAQSKNLTTAEKTALTLREEDLKQTYELAVVGHEIKASVDRISSYNMKKMSKIGLKRILDELGALRTSPSIRHTGYALASKIRKLFEKAHYYYTKVPEREHLRRSVIRYQAHLKGLSNKLPKDTGV